MNRGLPFVWVIDCSRRREHTTILWSWLWNLVSIGYDQLEQLRRGSEDKGGREES